jgi:hypothetical protein
MGFYETIKFSMKERTINIAQMQPTNVRKLLKKSAYVKKLTSTIYKELKQFKSKKLKLG